ncbi:hypothetical protein ACHAXS_001645 [Conticribra weissflogii]
MITADIMKTKITCLQIWTRQRQKTIIVSALYNLKFIGTTFREHFDACMHSLGHKSCLDDPDLWCKVCKQKRDNSYIESHNSYILVYFSMGFEGILWQYQRILSTKLPKALGQTSRCMNNAGDKQTKHSCGGFLIYVNTALVEWHLKQKATIETRVF